MKNTYLQQQVVFGRFTFPLVLVMTVIITLFIPDNVTPSSTVTNALPIWRGISKILQLDVWTLRLINTAFFIMVALFMSLLNSTYSLIRVRSSVPSFLFLTMYSFTIALHNWQPGGIIALLISFSLYFLLGSYQKSAPMNNIYHACTLLGFASLFCPELIFLLPVYLIGQYLFQSLTLKSLFAGLLGIAMPYLLLWAYAYIFQLNLIDEYTGAFTNLSLFDFSLLNNWKGIMLGFTLVVMIIAIIHLLINNWQDKIRTRDYLYFFIWFSLFLVVFILFQPQHFTIFYSLLLIGNAILVGHFFALAESKVVNVLFCSSLFILALIYLQALLWTQL
jgi:hypothetical protein